MTNQEINEARIAKYCTHFSLSEFTCQCGGVYCDGNHDTINCNLLIYLEDIRAHFGGIATTITSCLRCPTHNANVGGVSTSKHLYGLAVDFKIAGVDPAEIVSYCKTLPLYRYAYAISSAIGGAVHFDVVYEARDDDPANATASTTQAFSDDDTAIKISNYGDNFVPLCTAIGALGVVCHTATLGDGYFVTAAVPSATQIAIIDLCASYGATCGVYVAPVTEETETDVESNDEALAVLQAKVDALEAANTAIMTENAAYREENEYLRKCLAEIHKTSDV